MKSLFLAMTLTVLSSVASFAGAPSEDSTSATATPSPDESAKMGKEEGTHTGDHGIKSENDTKKVEQPERKNTLSNPE